MNNNNNDKDKNDNTPISDNKMTMKENWVIVAYDY